jgi:hypothetical protein
MNMLSVHNEALNNAVGVYHEFLLRYLVGEKVVYGFVEGKEDPCFYKGFIESQIDGNWEVELWAAGSKKNVLNIYKEFDWNNFPKTRICFFIDRDLSFFMNAKSIDSVNIYTTDGYSIENSIVNSCTFKRILTEICGFENLEKVNIDRLSSHFDDEYEKFLKYMITIMAWILYWRLNELTANLNDINMGDIFKFTDSHIEMKDNPKNKGGIIEYLHFKCNVKYDKDVEIIKYIDMLNKDNRYRKYTRGKYVFWFLVQYCLSIKDSYSMVIKTKKKVQKMNLTLSISNGMSIIGNRARIPNSLKKFFENTFIIYIKGCEDK